MPTRTNSTVIPEREVASLFNKVKGHSAIATLAAQTPIPFNGTDVMVFTMDGEASIVGEAGEKPAGEAGFKSITIKPLKVVYQHRLTDEFKYLADEKRIPYLQAFYDGFSKKIARALDIMAIHGMNPSTKTVSPQITSYFDNDVTEVITYAASSCDDNLDDAIAPIQNKDGEVTGIAMAPSFANAMGKIKTSNKLPAYPEFRFGQRPDVFGNMNININSTLSFADSKDKAIVGDFQNAFKWGFAKDVMIEQIEYGDPDGLGDLKRTNEIVLRSEAYIGFGILDADSFAIVREA